MRQIVGGGEGCDVNWLHQLGWRLCADARKQFSRTLTHAAVYDEIRRSAADKARTFRRIAPHVK